MFELVMVASHIARYLAVRLKSFYDISAIHHLPNTHWACENQKGKGTRRFRVLALTTGAGSPLVSSTPQNLPSEKKIRPRETLSALGLSRKIEAILDFSGPIAGVMKYITFLL